MNETNGWSVNDRKKRVDGKEKREKREERGEREREERRRGKEKKQTKTGGGASQGTGDCDWSGGAVPERLWWRSIEEHRRKR